MIKTLCVALALLSIGSVAQAGSTTFGYTAGAGTTFAAPTNGSSQLGAPFGTLCDGTALASCDAVKAASTAAIATDPSAVFQLSPNQPALTTPLNVGAAQTGTWTVQPGNTPNTSPWLASISDGTNTASVKAASTSAAATDKSVVVQINPQQTPPVATAVNVTPTNCSGTITAGGTAQSAITAQTTLHGFTIANIDNTSGSGEPIWISLTGTATASTNGSYPLSAPAATTFASLSSYTTPVGFGTNHAVSVVAATTGHAFSCTWW